MTENVGFSAFLSERFSSTVLFMKGIPIILAVLIMLGSAWSMTGARTLMHGHDCEGMETYHQIHHDPADHDEVGAALVCTGDCKSIDHDTEACTGFSYILHGGHGSDYLGELREISLLATDILIETAYSLFKSTSH